jgi:hypothetical protein
MRTTRKDTKSQGDITETVEQSATDMQEKLGDLDKIQQDVQTVRETLESLDFGGTTEGADAVEESVTGAEETTVDVFDREGEQLDDIQAENEEYEGELNEHSESDKSDLDKISNASNRIDTDETVSELVRAKEAALRDVDFLVAQIERAKSARDESENTQQEYKNQVHGGGH